MINDITISKAVPSDAVGIQKLTAESSKEMYILCGWTDAEISKHFNPEKITEGIEKLKSAILSFTDSDILLVARDRNKIIGCCFAERLKDRNRIEAVYVHPEYQRTGIGTRLYNEAYKDLDHYKKTYLDVFSLNSKAIGFYKEHGFVETGKKFFENKYINSKGEALEITEMILKPDLK